MLLKRIGVDESFIEMSPFCTYRPFRLLGKVLAVLFVIYFIGSLLYMIIDVMGNVSQEPNDKILQEIFPYKVIIS